ncbi:ABC transporter substrate-binding protein [Haloglycomyces albus]|uniref:ABC transporter substrate-binding protein n=1 Tax=Haloglycomyces albus TaxID=526067 RepID=UPI0004BBFCC4|nr:ABC transporter substrate-binding protein [Haloglycomyces albus]
MTTSQLNRRNLLRTAGILGVAGGMATAVSACGNEDDTTGGSDELDFDFTDDRDETVNVEGLTTAVAYTGMAAALSDFGAKNVTGVFGPTLDKDGNLLPEAQGLDKDKLTVLGNTWGEFDVEEYAGMNPQVLLTHYHNDPESLWYVPAEDADEILSLAPSAAINVDDGSNTLADVIERHAELAGALGADLDSDKLADDKAEFESAVTALAEAAADNPVTVLACSGAEEIFYASVPDMSCDLRYYLEQGVEFIVPDNPDDAGYYEGLSWENADKYEADILFVDARAQALQPDDMADFPTWKELPAVKAGQVVAWHAEPRFSYAGAAGPVQALADMIANATKVV